MREDSSQIHFFLFPPLQPTIEIIEPSKNQKTLLNSMQGKLLESTVTTNFNEAKKLKVKSVGRKEKVCN